MAGIISCKVGRAFSARDIVEQVEGVDESRAQVSKRFTQNGALIQTTVDKYKLAYAVVKPRDATEYRIKFAAKPGSAYAQDELYDVSALSAGSDKAKRLIFAFDNGVFKARDKDNMHARVTELHPEGDSITHVSYVKWTGAVEPMRAKATKVTTESFITNFPPTELAPAEDEPATFVTLENVPTVLSVMEASSLAQRVTLVLGATCSCRGGAEQVL